MMVVHYVLNLYALILIKEFMQIETFITLSERMRALSGPPTPMAISLTSAESNLALASFSAEASSQLQ